MVFWIDCRKSKERAAWSSHLLLFLIRVFFSNGILYSNIFSRVKSYWYVGFVHYDIRYKHRRYNMIKAIYTIYIGLRAISTATAEKDGGTILSSAPFSSAASGCNHIWGGYQYHASDWCFINLTPDLVWDTKCWSYCLCLSSLSWICVLLMLFLLLFSTVKLIWILLESDKSLLHIKSWNLIGWFL